MNSPARDALTANGRGEKSEQRESDREERLRRPGWNLSRVHNYSKYMIYLRSGFKCISLFNRGSEYAETVGYYKASALTPGQKMENNLFSGPG